MPQAAKHFAKQGLIIAAHMTIADANPCQLEEAKIPFPLPL
jgi:hypothetical protein